MKVKFVIMGKTLDKSLLKLINEYMDRLKHYISFEQIVIPELKQTKNLSIEQQKEREYQLFFSKIESSDYLVLLDERGKMLTSIEFADFIESKFNLAIKSIVFVIGGPYGFSKKMYERANYELSLSKMTFSHQMVRLFFVEQLYRAMTIIRGEPYHHQ